MSEPCLPLSTCRAMVANPLTVEGHSSVRVALATLAQARDPGAMGAGGAQGLRQALTTNCVVVVDGDRRVRGLLTAMDGVRLLTQDPPLALPLDQCPVERVMTPATVVWRASALPDWSEMVNALGAGHPIPVVDDQDRLVGLVGAETVAAMAVPGNREASESADQNSDSAHQNTNRDSVLQDRETRYQALMDQASDAIMIADLEGNILEVNRQTEKLLGYTTAELTTMHFTQLHPPEDMPRIVSAFEQLANQQVCQVLDVNFRRRDGQVVPVDISASVISLPERPIIQGIFRDIRERKAMEQALRQEEQRERQRADREKILGEITQRIRQSLELQTIFDTACPEIRQVLAADRVGIFRFDHLGSGNNQTGQFVAESVGPNLPSILAVPVSDYRQRSVYQPLYQGDSFVAIPDLLTLDANEHSVLLGFQVRASLVVPLISGDHLWGLLCIHQCDGPRQWSEADVALAQHLANQLAIAIYQASLFGQIQRELAERQQAQQQLSERNQQLAISNQELARATRLKDEFLATMSHELRTPLNAVLGMAEGMEDLTFGPITPQQRHALQIIERSGNHLLELINDILDVAKIEAGQITLDLQTLDVPRLCAASLAFIHSQAIKKRIQVHTDIAPHLPPVWLDERRMRQVLINLLNNAVKFTPEGGEITLSASVSPTNQRLYLAVSDTGIGIAEADQSRLFQPFVQIDSALNRQYSGTGLGLALVKQIVDLHGGTVSLTSRVGRGSCFTLDLPLDPPPQPPEATPAMNQPTHPTDSLPATPAQPPLILLAEDNEANILTLSSYLQAKGYRLHVVNNGQDAVTAALAENPDLVLMDIQMPVMDGLTAIQHIRQTRPLEDLPIIALTALAMEGDRERCFQAGANDYLSKPVRLKELLSLIQTFLPVATP